MNNGIPTDSDGHPLAWTEADMAKPWGVEAAFLRNLADHGGLEKEVAMMLRHCATGITRSGATTPMGGVVDGHPAGPDTYGFGLSPQEKEVLDISAALYNAIAELPDKHPSDMGETLLDIHRIQNRVMARVAVRNQPNVFNCGDTKVRPPDCVQLPTDPLSSVIRFTGHADMPIEAIEIGDPWSVELPSNMNADHPPAKPALCLYGAGNRHCVLPLGHEGECASEADVPG